MGHPLVNAIFNGTSLFALLCLRMPGLLKSLIFMVMLAAMVAFGGRSALTVTLAGLVILGMIECWKYFMSRGMSVLRLASLFLALLLIPAVCGGLLYGVMHSGIGERLMAYDSLEDDSASVRLASISVVNFMTTDDIIFGMDGDQIAAIGQHAGIGAPTSDIENPWILMFMFLGALIFPIWLCGLFCCMWRLMSGAPPALKIGLIAYFCMSSTSNSFGRKDPVYMLLPGIIVCIKRLKEQKKI